MQIKVLYVERKVEDFFSIEKVTRQIAKGLSKKIFDISYEQLKFLSDLPGVFKNLFSYKPPVSDIYHIMGHINYITLILPRNKTVLTVHDVGILFVRKGIRRFILKKMLFDLPFRRLEYITTISEKTKSDIIKYTNCREEKIRLIENPLDENFNVEEKPEFNADCPRILQIGTAPHKNLPNVIKALEGINCLLIIIGKLDAPTISLLKEKNINYQNEYGLDDDAVKQHYQLADLSVFCSLFEGFGLPIIESQAMKTPVITSNINPMKEVAGDGALLVDPHDHTQIREAVIKMIADKSLRENLVNNGIENIKRYEYKAIAEKYAELYREIYEKNQI